MRSFLKALVILVILIAIIILGFRVHAHYQAIKAEQLSDTGAELLNNLTTYIHNTNTLENYTTSTVVTSETELVSDGYEMNREIHINSAHKMVVGVPYISQMTDEFTYLNGSLHKKSSWLSYMVGNTLGVKYMDDSYKWTTQQTTANVNYGNLADKMIVLSNDTVKDVQVDGDGVHLTYKVDFKPENAVLEMRPVGLYGIRPTSQSITKANLLIEVNTNTGLIEQSTFTVEYTTKECKKTKDGEIWNASESEVEGLAKVSALCTETTTTQYSNIDNTDFEVDLSAFKEGSPQSFSPDKTSTAPTQTITYIRFD